MLSSRHMLVAARKSSRSGPNSNLFPSFPESCIPMTTYEQSNFEQIATAIDMEVGQIWKHENLFEAAALWYRLNRRRPTRVASSNLLRKLDRVAKSARRLLKNLGVNDPDEAANGPGDRDILNALVLVVSCSALDTMCRPTGKPPAVKSAWHRGSRQPTQIDRIGVGDPGDDVLAVELDGHVATEVEGRRRQGRR